MNRHIRTTIGFMAFAMASAAHAGSVDYYLKIDGIDGEARAASWSFGVCNAGSCSSGSTKRTISSPRDVATGQASGKRQHKPVSVTASQNTQSLRESPTRASTGKTAIDETAPEASKTGSPVKANWDLAKGKGAREASSGGVNVAAGDLDGDGLADLAFAGTQAEIESLSLNFTKIEWAYRDVCKGKHIAKATLRNAADEFTIEHAMVECTSNADQSVTMTLTGGQMKHTKTGHVTLLK